MSNDEGLVKILNDIVKVYDAGKSGVALGANQGQPMDGFSQLANYTDLAQKAKKILENNGEHMD